MAKQGGGKFKGPGRRKRATQRREGREREENALNAEREKVAAATAAEKAEAAKLKHVSALTSRGLLGAGLHDSIAGLVPKKRTFGIADDERTGKKSNAYEQLLAKLPKKGAFGRLMATSQARARGTDEGDASESEEEDKEVIRLERSVRQSAPTKSSGLPRREKETELDEDDYDHEDTDEHDDVDEDEGSDDPTDGPRNPAQASNGFTGSKRGRNASLADESDAESDAPAEQEEEAESDAPVSDAEGKGDVFISRYMTAALGESEITRKVRENEARASTSDVHLPGKFVGAGWDAATQIVASGVNLVDINQTLKHMAAEAKVTENRLHPPAYDLAEDKVKAKVTTAWNSTYGRETQSIVAASVKSAVRSAKKARVDAPGVPEVAAKELQQQHPFTPLQRLIWPALNSYQDLAALMQTHSNARELRSITCLHIVNHVVKARELVLKHEAKMKERIVKLRVEKLDKAVAAASSTAKASAGSAAALDEAPEYKDQGFTRPRVLILAPTKNIALKYVRNILRLLPGRQISNRNRFFLEFTDESSGLGADYEDDEEELKAAREASHADTATRKERLQLLMASLARRDKEMMSDTEDVEDIEGGAGGNSSVYPYNKQRQGWSKNLLAQHLASRHEAGATRAVEDDTDTEDEEKEDETMLPFSAIGGIAGRKKFDDRILPDSNTFAPDRRGKKKRKHTSTKRNQPAPAATSIPQDHKMTFSGNVDDDFKVGISVNKKVVKLFSDFYDADIIIASPLGLRRVIGGEGDKKRDYDFLSSIEVLVLDSAHMFLMQNWEHLNDIFAVLNNPLSKMRDTDFSRVREWNLAGLAKHFRQTICFSAFPDLLINRLVRKACSNIAGNLVLRMDYAGTITKVVPTVKQVFQRIHTTSMADADDARFNYFKDKILPELEAGISSEAGGILAHTMIYVPSYFDYVRLRNLFDGKDLEFVTCSEYSEDSDIRRSRSRFFTGQSPVMLLTERFHFFRRLKIRGIRHIIFYSPPTVHWFYDEFLNFLEEAAAAKEPISSTLLFTKYDVLQLERLIGTDRSSRLLEDTSKNTFYFV